MPITTCAAPTICPMRIIVAFVRGAVTGTCRRSNASRRSSRVIAFAPSALRSSVRRTADASPSQKIRPSRVTFSNGTTRTRLGPGIVGRLRECGRRGTRDEHDERRDDAGPRAPHAASTSGLGADTRSASAISSTHDGSPVPRQRTTTARVGSVEERAGAS